MEIEHKHFSFPVDNNLQEAVKALEAEGWQQIPGVVPVMVYYLTRQKNGPAPQPEAPVSGALGVMRIREDLVTVVGPDGKSKP